jgi:hypothetical protein
LLPSILLSIPPIHIERVKIYISEAAIILLVTKIYILESEIFLDISKIFLSHCKIYLDISKIFSDAAKILLNRIKINIVISYRWIICVNNNSILQKHYFFSITPALFIKKRNTRMRVFKLVWKLHKGADCPNKLFSKKIVSSVGVRFLLSEIE